MKSSIVMYHLGKIPNMAYQYFWEESFTDFGTMLEFAWLSSHRGELGYCKNHGELSTHGPMFCVDAQLFIANNFAN